MKNTKNEDIKTVMRIKKSKYYLLTNTKKESCSARKRSFVQGMSLSHKNHSYTHTYNILQMNDGEGLKF